MLDLTLESLAFALLCGLLWSLRGLAYLILALALHELGHLAVLTFCNIPILRIRLRFADVEILTGPLPYRVELLCALAGPLVNLALYCCTRRILAPFAAVNLLLGGFNLLPLLPLDGGRSLRALLCLFLPDAVAGRILRLWTAAAVLLSLLLSILHCLLRHGGPLPVVLCAGLGIRFLLSENSNCFWPRKPLQ